jgi:hypothetical protein
MPVTSLALLPKHWYSWDFTLVSGDRTLADLDLSSWREKGVVTIGGHEHRVFREGMVSGDFVIERDGQVLARATKPSAFRNTVIVTHGGRHYTLRKRSVWKRAFVLLEGDREIGSLSPNSWLTRDATVNLPPDWPLAVKTFVTWLAIILWKREADSSGA